MTIWASRSVWKLSPLQLIALKEAAAIYTLAEQIAQLSSRITLYPDDVILTGTPAGVGAGRGEFLNARRCCQAMDRKDRHADQYEGVIP